MKEVNGKPTSYVYLLRRKEEVVYVGQSMSFDSLLRRIQSHRSSKVFDGISFIPTDKDDLDNTEAANIMKFTPEYNCKLPSNVKYYSYTRLLNIIGDKIKMGIKSYKVGETNYYSRSSVDDLLSVIDDKVKELTNV